MTRLSARLGRHSLLLQALALQQIDEILEPVVFDHFETFVYSQDDRLGIATPIGQRSWFLYGIQAAPHRRAGRRSARKRSRRGPLPEPVPGSVVRSTRETLDLLVPKASWELTLVSDDHPAYGLALARHPSRHRIRRRVFPNPPRGPGTDPGPARERDREMVAVDAFHKLWRHSQAHHRRETIAFGRRSNALLERAALMMCWRNLIKGLSERRNDPTTPAMRLGITSRPWTWRDVFAKRCFPLRIDLSESWMRIYRREWVTPAVGNNTRHDLRHAFRQRFH